MLITRTFSYSHNVSYPSINKFLFLSHFYFSSATGFNLDKSKILLFGKELNYTNVFKVVLHNLSLTRDCSDK